MFNQIPKVEEIESLTAKQLLQIKLTYELICRDPAWTTGLAALADTYGWHMDDDGLLDLEDAAKSRTRDHSLTAAVRWYYLGLNGRKDLAAIQAKALSQPWENRGGK